MNGAMARSAARRLMAGVAFVGSLAVTTSCEVGVAEYPDDYYYDYYPPDAYIATTAPIYYDGYPTYWWHGHWYYRAGGRWAHYGHEPPVLYTRRIHAPPPIRRNYEPAFHGRVYGGFHGGARGVSHGGAHGGRR
jgi:hypothetical protein